jgi:3-deoxy-D-manno-octulosonate 8-phosphate phosphatase (KDO 8-P phosphatase)
MVKLLILDVDGVLTDGRKYYDSSGLATHKTFCDKDFTAIKKFKSIGCEVIFLSGDKNINEKIAENRFKNSTIKISDLNKGNKK